MPPVVGVKIAAGVVRAHTWSQHIGSYSKCHNKSTNVAVLLKEYIVFKENAVGTLTITRQHRPDMDQM